MGVSKTNEQIQMKFKIPNLSQIKIKISNLIQKSLASFKAYFRIRTWMFFAHSKSM